MKNLLLIVNHAKYIYLKNKFSFGEYQKNAL